MVFDQMTVQKNYPTRQAEAIAGQIGNDIQLGRRLAAKPPRDRQLRRIAPAGLSGQVHDVALKLLTDLQPFCMRDHPLGMGDQRTGQPEHRSGGNAGDNAQCNPKAQSTGFWRSRVHCVLDLFNRRDHLWVVDLQGLRRIGAGDEQGWTGPAVQRVTAGNDQWATGCSALSVITSEASPRKT